MNRIDKCIEKLWDGGVPVTCVALLVVLLTVSILITGAGLHSAVVWIILASVSVLCVALCSCMNCKRRISRWRRTSERSDTISTISDVNDFMHIMYPQTEVSASYWRRDSLPGYTDVMGTDQLPPPYSVVAHTCPLPANIAQLANVTQALDSEPPPYDTVVNNRQVTVESARDSISSTAERVNVLSANKINTILANNETASMEMQEVDGRIIIESGNVECEPEEENSSC